MSDQLRDAWDKAVGEDEQSSDPLKDTFNRVVEGRAGTPEELFSDPDFQSLTDFHSVVLDGSAGPTAVSEARAGMRDKIATLTAKYDLEPERLSELSRGAMTGEAPLRGGGAAESTRQGQVGEAAREAFTGAPLASAVGRVAGDAAREGVKAGRQGVMFAAEVLEPLWLPQQEMFRSWATFARAARATIEEARHERELDAFLAGERETKPEEPEGFEPLPPVDIVSAVTPGFSDTYFSFGDVLREAGVPEDATFTVGVQEPFGVTFVRALQEGKPIDEMDPIATRELNVLRTLGLAGDIALDPLLAGPYVSGLGRAVRPLARETGESLMRAGRNLESQLSLTEAGRSARGAARTLAPRVVEGTEQRFASILSSVLNAPVPGMERLTTKGASIGELLLQGGRTDEMLFPGLEPGPGAMQGGVGRDEALLVAERGGRATIDDAMAAVNDRLATARQALGPTRYRKWLQDIKGALSTRAAVTQRVASYPQVLRDELQTLAAELADNRGILTAPHVIANLEDVPLRSRPLGQGTDAFGRESVTGRTLAEELAPLQEAMPARESTLLAKQRERARKAAKKAGFDPDRAANAMEYMADKFTEADVILGYNMSLYEPIKQRFFAEVARQGGNVDDANRLWGEAYATAISGGDLSSGASETLNKVIDSLGTQQLDVRKFFDALANGHLRRAYATTEGSWETYLRRVRNGVYLNNRIVDSTMLNDGLKNRVSGNVQELIRDYFERVSPTVEGESGFVIHQDNLVRHLTENGVPAREARDAIGEIVNVANPQLEEVTARVERQMRNQEGVAGMGNTGPSTGASISAQRRELDVDALAQLGRLWDGEYALRESAQAASRGYPKKQFIAEVERIARKAGAVFNTKERDNLTFIPEHEAYGPLSGKWVHPQVKKEVDNVLREGSGAARSWNRIRSLITSGLLTRTATIGRNHAGGTLSAMLAGLNPIEHMGEVMQVYQDAARAGGIRNLPEYQKMGDLVITGMAEDNIIRGMRPYLKEARRIKEKGGTMQNLGAVVSQDLPEWYRKVLVDQEALSPIMGLEAFQLSENTHKIAAYREMLRRTGNADDAYRMASQVTFDYANMPRLLRMANDTALLPFASFPYFMFARTISAALNRPGTIAAADRVANAVWHAAIPNDDERYALWRELEDWERGQRVIPIRERDGGARSMFPLGMAFPTDPFADNPYTGSISQLGLIQGGVDAVTSMTRSGEAFLGQQYGRMVFEPDTSPGEAKWARQLGSYIFNSYAPASARQFWSPSGAGSDVEGGAIPAIGRLVRPIWGDGLGKYAMRLAEEREGRMQRDWFEETMTQLIGTTRPRTTDPAFSILRTEGGSRGFEIREEIQFHFEEMREIDQDASLSPQEKLEKIRPIEREVEQLYNRLNTLLEDVDRGNAPRPNPPLRRED